MRGSITFAIPLSALLLLLFSCGEETCKTVCVHCGAVRQADCRDDCQDAYGGTADCRKKLRGLEECVLTASCDMESCGFELNRVDDTCDFDVRDYWE
jgi:hypothetical protein